MIVYKKITHKQFLKSGCKVTVVFSKLGDKCNSLGALGYSDYIKEM